MEKRRFCDFRLLALCLILICPLGLEAQDQVREIQVEVDVPIERGDMASATRAAQREAFRKAVELSLPADLTESQRESRMRNASNYIKSFRTLRQEERSGRLFAVLVCEVMVADSGREVSRPQELGFDRFAIEVIWRGGRSTMTAASLRELLSNEYQARVGKMKIQKGSLWIDMSSSLDPGDLYARLQSRLRSKAELRLVRDIYGLDSEEATSPFDASIFEESRP